MFHLIAFGESVLTAGTLQALTPVPDNTITINGNLAYVPKVTSMLARAATIVGGSSTYSEARVQSPSLREMFYPAVTPLNQGTNFAGESRVTRYDDTPIPLVVNEGLEFYSDGGGDGATAQNPYGLVFLSDGPITMAKGRMFTMRATAAITLAANTWVNGALTFDQTLPVGEYDIVGMRGEGTGLIASRLNFIGASAVTRPGVPCHADGTSQGDDHFRFGEAGLFGTFDSVTPPSVDCLGATGTSQVFYFDLVQRAA